MLFLEISNGFNYMYVKKDRLRTFAQNQDAPSPWRPDIHAHLSFLFLSFGSRGYRQIYDMRPYMYIHHLTLTYSSVVFWP